MSLGKLITIHHSDGTIHEVYGGDLFITGEAKGYFKFRGLKFTGGKFNWNGDFKRFLFYSRPAYSVPEKLFYLGIYAPIMINGNLCAHLDLGEFMLMRRELSFDTFIQIKEVCGEVVISNFRQLCLKLVLIGPGEKYDEGHNLVPVENCARDIIGIDETSLNHLINQAEDALLLLL